MVLYPGGSKTTRYHLNPPDGSSSTRGVTASTRLTRTIRRRPLLHARGSTGFGEDRSVLGLVLLHTLTGEVLMILKVVLLSSHNSVPVLGRLKVPDTLVCPGYGRFGLENLASFFTLLTQSPSRVPVMVRSPDFPTRNTSVTLPLLFLT